MAALLSVALAGGMLVGVAEQPVSAATSYSNCIKLNKVYPHGVGKPNAVDHVRAHTRRVTSFTRSKALYRANTARDRDKDGIACEKL